MSEDINVLRKIIIEEYLSNWFTYEELSSYLCLDIDIFNYSASYANNHKLDVSIMWKK